MPRTSRQRRSTARDGARDDGPSSARPAGLLRNDRTLCLLIVLVTFAAFAPLLAADFTNWDDPHTVAHNPRLNPPTLASLLAFWSEPQASLYAPVTYTVWTLLASVAYVSTPDPAGVHLNPLVFHAANVALHACSALAAFALLRRLTGHAPASAAGALLFALHPVQVESVGWVSGTKDVLWGTFALVALWQYVAYAQVAPAPESNDAGPPGEPGRPRPALHFSLATAAFVLAMLSKPTAVVVPVAAAVIDVLLVRRSVARAARSLWPWFVLAVPVLIVGKHAQPALQSSGHAVPLHVRPLLAGDALAFYLGKLVLPLDLGLIYDHAPPAVLASGRHRWAWAVPAAVFALALFVWRRRRGAAWAVAAFALFVVGVAPVLSLVPFEFQQLSTVADHYLYVSMLGPALAVAFAAARWGRSRGVVVGLSVVLVALGVRSFAQARTWRDAVTLFERALRVNPNGEAVYANLSEAYHAANRFADALRTDEAAAARWPASAGARVNLAGSLARVGRVDEAVEQYRAALRLDPSMGAARAALERLESRRAATRPARDGDRRPSDQPAGSLQ